jgi:hypothetical protein
MKTFFQSRRKAVISLNVIHECSVSANLRCIKDYKEGSSGWLFLVCYIGVPCYATVSVRKKAFEFAVATVAVDEMDLWVSFGSTACLAV